MKQAAHVRAFGYDSTGYQLFAVRYDLSRQRLFSHQRSEATDTSMHYDTICLAVDISFSFRYDLSRQSAKLVRNLG